MPHKYYEKLPSACPPSDATTANNEVFYRIVNSNPAGDDDFYSYNKLGKWNAKTSTQKDECIACAVSVWKDLEACKNIQKIAKNKKRKIAALKLTDGDGLVKQTLSKYHYSWWRSDKFSITENITYQ